MKMCNACGETKPYSEFNRNSETPDGYRYTCKLCRKNKVPTNPEFTRLTRKRQDPSKRVPYATRKNYVGSEDWSEIKRLLKYDLTVEERDKMIADQKNACAICRKEFIDGRFHIDHCHETNKVRGLLCSGCNTGLGQLGDNIEGLQRAMDYLRKTNVDNSMLAS